MPNYVSNVVSRLLEIGGVSSNHAGSLTYIGDIHCAIGVNLILRKEMPVNMGKCALYVHAFMHRSVFTGKRHVLK